MCELIFTSKKKKKKKGGGGTGGEWMVELLPKILSSEGKATKISSFRTKSEIHKNRSGAYQLLFLSSVRDPADFAMSVS